MCPGPMVVGEIAGQDAAQMAFAQNEGVIETLMPDRADETLGERILPRAAARGQGFLDTKALDTLPERLPVGPIAIAEAGPTARSALSTETALDEMLQIVACG